MKTRLLSVIALAAILFTACSNDDSVATTDPNERTAVNFSTGDGVQTKVGGADGDEWNAGDNIGIFMIKDGEGLSTGNILEGADNKNYQAESDAKSTSFTPATLANIIYYPVDVKEKVDFIAYHPWSSEPLTDFKRFIDLTKQENQSLIDIMYSDNAKDYGKNSDDVKLSFDHQLAKLDLTIVKGDGVESLDKLEVTIKEMIGKGHINLVNKELDHAMDASNNYDSEDITPNEITAGDKYEAILFPVELDKHCIEFKLGENVYKWVMKNENPTTKFTKLEGGNRYKYTVTIKKTGISVTGTIVPWADNSGTGSAD